MPAEWEAHAATWLAWPHYQPDWPGKFEPIPWVYAEIIRYLSRGERVEVIVKDQAAEKSARKVLKRAHALNDNVRFHRWATNRVWTRDTGCAFVVPWRREVSEALGAVKWRFNAWAKYSNWQKDNKVGSLMAEAAGAREIQATFEGKPMVLEGGSIDVNGQGTLLTTEECLLSKVQQRNPGMKRRDYERVFDEYLGVSNVIWLGAGVAGDDTHGHVDDITRFVSPDTVVTCVDADPASDNYAALRENIRRLRDAATEDGKPLATIDLPLPAPVYFEGRRLPASYANFYIANAGVLVPVFNDPNDRVALDILADIFPERDVVGIYCGDLIWGLGAIHCMTQQQPAL
ncbi:MAG TPA: agmatine deiminase family protein [Terriglobales bacterium]|nr:agmatine deiminase family protein [Terriglobales bacterium]